MQVVMLRFFEKNKRKDYWFNISNNCNNQTKQELNNLIEKIRSKYDIFDNKNN